MQPRRYYARSSAMSDIKMMLAVVALVGMVFEIDMFRMTGHVVFLGELLGH